MGIAEEIEKLSELRKTGSITEEEFQETKASLLEKMQAAGEKQSGSKEALNVNSWCMLIHLSQFAGYAVPAAGLVLPIVLWQTKKKESELIDQHGKIVVNWLITAFIFGVISFALCFVFIGFLLIPLLVLASVIFAIVGAIKANNGEVWEYPFSFKFIK
jgi:hypothetical protein